MVIRCSRIRNFHYPSRKWLLLFQATGRIMSGIKKTFTYVKVNYSCKSYRLGEKFNKDFDIACSMLCVMTTTSTCDVQSKSRTIVEFYRENEIQSRALIIPYISPSDLSSVRVNLK